MSIRENHYFTHPRAPDAIRAELERHCPDHAAGLSLTSAESRAQGHLCLPSEGAVGVWIAHEAAPAGRLWNRAVFYTVHEGNIYVEEIVGVEWSNSDVTDHATAWLRSVHRGAKEEHRVPGQSTGEPAAEEPSA